MARLSILSVFFVALALAAMMVGGAAAAAAAASARQTTWLADVLQPAHAPSAGVAAQHYAGVVWEKVSLPILKGDGCDCVDAGTCNGQIFSQTLSCPSEQPSTVFQSLNGFGGSPGVASCTFQVSYGNGAINELAPGVRVIGTVSFICNFNGGADKCDSPLRNGMTITGFGRVVDIRNNAANTKVYYTSWGRPAGMDEADNVCGGTYVRQGARKNSAAGKRAEAAVSTASYYYDDEADTLYYPAGASESVHILLGTFTVVSAHSPTKFTSGRIQSVAAYYGTTDPSVPPTPVTSLPAGAFVFTPWTVDLEFASAQDSYY